MFLVNPEMVDISVGTALLAGVLGYAVVFFGLILLMCVVVIVGKIMVSRSAKQPAPAAAPAAAAPAAAPVNGPAPGTAGEFKLNDVDPKTAAMAMAIVADQLGKPLNELRFKSIKEVK